MKTATQRALETLFIILVCLTAPSTYAQGEPPDAVYTYLVGMQSKLLDYGKDFTDYAKDGQGNLQYEIPMDMDTVTSSTFTDIGHVVALYKIYELVDSEDKARIRPIVIGSLTDTIQRINENIDEINNGLSHAQRAVIIRSGGNLKQDLRGLSDRISRFKDRVQN